jgi:hypothetical protein
VRKVLIRWLVRDLTPSLMNFHSIFKGLDMTKFWEFIAFLILGSVLGYMFAVALLGV